MSADTTLTAEHERLIAWAMARAQTLYEGTRTPHRSCGIALAETFALPTRPYQSLRRGGITGCGECGAIKAGELILGELLGDPDPRGGVTPALRQAALRYRALWLQHVERGASSSIICNELTGQFDAFVSDERHRFCTELATSVARCVAQTLLEQGFVFTTPPLNEDAQP